jgi:hypothetical protein
MSRYFNIMSGLRGCYMPDSAYTVRVDTRKELKAILADCAEYLDGPGLSKRNIAWLAAQVWRGKDGLLPCGNGYHRGLECVQATRAEYLENQEGN